MLAVSSLSVSLQNIQDVAQMTTTVCRIQFFIFLLPFFKSFINNYHHIFDFQLHLICKMCKFENLQTIVLVTTEESTSRPMISIGPTVRSFVHSFCCLFIPSFVLSLIHSFYHLFIIPCFSKHHYSLLEKHYYIYTFTYKCILITF